MKVERSGRVNDMVIGLPAISWRIGAGLGLRCCKEVSGAKQEDARHPELALHFQTPKSETSNASFSLGPEYGSIRYILNEGKKEGHRTDWKSKAVDITIRY